MFDPLGWLAPATSLAKIWIQSTWLLGVDWDAPLPEAHALRWRSFHSEMSILENIRVPRWMGCEEAETTSVVHGFADASERAFAAIVYLRSAAPSGEVKVRLLAAKTKVAPLKPVTLPRLELCASALLAKFAAHLREVLCLREPSVLWSDSTVTLGWIQGHPSQWKTYIANRVSEIQTSVPDAIWRHIPGRDNPADCASRGLLPAELRDHGLWWTGPSWLCRAPEEWPAPGSAAEPSDLPERRTYAHVSRASDAGAPEDEMLTRFSDLRRLCRVTAWCLRWRSRKMPTTLKPARLRFLTAEELKEARLR
ncbi:uncharacterized protein [Cardiocondyla obscurior]|uniref:uncharacterized protein n=1 Tax=Cardiocondyla obscurior TaxID=286306 RepID=UPI0039657824